MAQPEEHYLLRAAELSRSAVAQIQQEYRRRLSELSFTPAQRRQVERISAAAGVSAVKGGGTFGQFFDFVRHSALELARSGIPRETVRRAMAEFENVADPVCSADSGPNDLEIRAAWKYLHQSVQLIIAEAFLSFQHSDAELMRAVLAAQSQIRQGHSLIDIGLRRVVSRFGASAGALFTDGPDGLNLAGHTEPLQAKAPLRATRSWLRKRHSLLPIDEGAAKVILLPHWLDVAETVWSVPLDRAVVQLSFDTVRPMHPAEADLIHLVISHSIDAASRLDRVKGCTELPLRMIGVEETERHRIARELHNDAAQTLALLRLQLELADMALPAGAEELRTSFAEIRENTEKAIFEVRRLISELTPPPVEQHGLNHVIRQLSAKFEGSHPVRVKLRLNEIPRLHPKLQILIYRIVQECFTNIRRHSQAGNVKIFLTATDKTLKLSVEDDGKGFHANGATGSHNGYGLASMRERTAGLGGVFTVSSPLKSGEHRRSGTRIQVELPLIGEYPDTGTL